jgi:nitroreductase
VPVRDFEKGVSGEQLIEQDAGEYAKITVVIRPRDSPIDHLRAGEAMMRLMLASPRRGLGSCPLGHAVDLAAFRVRMQVRSTR